MANEGKQSNRLAFVGQLAGGLAHEIKNPLSTMLVTLQLLKEDWEDSTESRGRRTVQKVDLMLKEVNRLEGILNEFLRFASGPEMNLEDVVVNDVIQEVLDFVEPETTRFDIRIRYAPAPDLPTCRIDVNLFKQALFNIVINAQHAMEEDGGELMLKTELIAGQSVRIQIVDTGKGIPDEVVDRVFDVYFSTKRRGTGLGLATARRFIEEHDGTIELQSEAGKGTIVTVLLPVSPDGAIPARRGSDNGPEGVDHS